MQTEREAGPGAPALSKVCTGNGSGSKGRLLGKSYQELTFACDSVGCFLGHVVVVVWSGVGLV